MSARFYRSDTDGSLKAAALQAAARVWASKRHPYREENVIETAEVFYAWLTDTSSPRRLSFDGHGVVTATPEDADSSP